MNNRVHVASCPVCSEEKFSPFIKVEDHMISKETFDLVSCDNCGFVFTNPIPSLDCLGDYYKSDEYVSHSSTSKGIINWLYHKVREKTLNQKKQLIDKLSKNKKVLDVGAGTGHFVRKLKDNGYSVIGIEPDADARKLALELNEVYLLKQEHLYELDAASIDVVTMWHVLEHIPNLNEDLERMSAILGTNGYMVVAVPNRASFDALHYKEYWAAYDVPRHLYHFRKTDLICLMEKHQLQLVDVIPMKFDAFYVSMLSEKYKKGSLLKALWIGFISNMKAKKADGYSSQIYIFRKKTK